MKNYITILILLVSFSSSFGQVNIGNGRGAGNLWVAKHKEKTFETLKNTNTIFVLPNLKNKEELQSNIKSIWTYNEISFVDSDDYEPNKKNYISSDNMIIKLLDLDYSVTKGIRTIGHFNKNIFLVNIYRNIKENKKGNLDYDFLDIAEIYLDDDIIFQNSENDLYYIRLGIVKNYFQELNRRLTNSQNLKMIDGIVKKEKMGFLSEKALCVPWRTSDSASIENKEQNQKYTTKIFKKYKHQIELLTDKELEEKILNGEDFYYLQLTQFSAFRIYSIIHSISGEIIYLDINKATYQTKSSHLNKISNTISKNS